MDIPQIIEAVLSAANIESVESIEQLVAVDTQARQAALAQMKVLC